MPRNLSVLDADFVNVRVRPTHIRFLKEGDVFIVRGFNAVTASQLITQLFSPPVTRRGSYTSVHAMIVVAVQDDYLTVCHVVRTGASQDYIRDSTMADLQRGSKIQVFEASVYRLPHYKHRRLARAAAEEARLLVESRRIGFSHWGSIGSVFKDLKVDEKIDWKSLYDLDGREPLKMFCSEFIVKCYQNAMRKLGLRNDPYVTRTLSISADACTPMALEGYFLHNREMYQDWQYVGDVSYAFC